MNMQSVSDSSAAQIDIVVRSGKQASRIGRSVPASLPGLPQMNLKCNASTAGNISGLCQHHISLATF